MPWLEIQSILASSVGEALDAPMIQISAAVEDDLADTGSLRALGDQLADSLSGIDVAALALGRLLAAKGGVEWRRGHEGLAGDVVDDLHVDVVGAAVHVEARALLGARHSLAYTG